MEQVKVQLTESAYNDLEDIELYIAQDSPAIARKFIGHIFDKIYQLHSYPYSGKPVPEINDKSIRELLLNKYRIIYQVTVSGDVNVLRVVHGARLLDIEL